MSMTGVAYNVLVDMNVSRDLARRAVKGLEQAGALVTDAHLAAASACINLTYDPTCQRARGLVPSSSLSRLCNVCFDAGMDLRRVTPLAPVLTFGDLRKRSIVEAAEEWYITGNGAKLTYAVEALLVDKVKLAFEKRVPLSYQVTEDVKRTLLRRA